MATVTITFRDDVQGEEGVAVEIRSDPPMPESHEKATEAQKMAIGALHLLEAAINDHEEVNESSADDCPALKPKKSCGHGSGGCGSKHANSGHCSRHKDTPPEECCQK